MQRMKEEFDAKLKQITQENGQKSANSPEQHLKEDRNLSHS
jgi:hypothetical protein